MAAEREAVNNQGRTPICDDEERRIVERRDHSGARADEADFAGPDGRIDDHRRIECVVSFGELQDGGQAIDAVIILEVAESAVEAARVGG